MDGRRRSRGRGCRKWFPRRSIQHGAKRNRRSGTHPRRAPLGVVHERQSVPRVETLRAGEAVAPDQGEDHGRGRERARRGVNETRSSENYRVRERKKGPITLLLLGFFPVSCDCVPYDVYEPIERFRAPWGEPARFFARTLAPRAADREAWSTSEMVAAAAEPEKAAAAPAGGKVRGPAPSRSRPWRPGRPRTPDLGFPEPGLAPKPRSARPRGTDARTRLSRACAASARARADAANFD